MMGGSPWFGFHKDDFGLGNAVAVQKRYTHTRTLWLERNREKKGKDLKGREISCWITK